MTMNEQKFNSLKKSEQRVIIAKDALKWLRSKMIMASAGVVCDIAQRAHNSKSQESAQQFLVNNIGKTPCNVCLRGALLISSVVNSNKFTVGELHEAQGFFSTDNPVDKKLMEHFSPMQLQLMEWAFEDSSNGVRFYSWTEAIAKYNPHTESDVDNAVEELRKEYRSLIRRWIRTRTKEWAKLTDNTSIREYFLQSILENIIRNKGTFRLK